MAAFLNLGHHETNLGPLTQYWTFVALSRLQTPERMDIIDVEEDSLAAYTQRRANELKELQGLLDVKTEPAESAVPLRKVSFTLRRYFFIAFGSVDA